MTLVSRSTFQLKARVEEMERKADWSPAHGTTTTSQGPKAGFPAETARDTEEKAVGEGSQEHVHGIVETVKEALEQPIEAGRRAAQVTVERVTQAVQVRHTQCPLYIRGCRCMGHSLFLCGA